MSPQRDDQLHHCKRELQGTRPSPLKVSKESHQIHKASSSATSSSSSSSSASSSFTQQRHPVIIYTHSPKVIHTQAHDFMALVQKLTGLSSSDAPSSSLPPSPPPQLPSSPPSPTQPRAPLGLSCGDLEGLAFKSSRIGREDASSSVVTDDNCVDNIPATSSAVSPMFEVRNPFFSDVPLYTPTASDYYCSPHPLYRFADPVFSPTNLGGSLSPNIMEVLKAFPDY